MVVRGDQFLQGAMMQQRSNQDLLGLLRGLSNQAFRSEQQRQSRIEAERAAAMEPSAILAKATTVGVENLTPQEMGILQAYDIQKTSQMGTDMLGNVYQKNRSIFDALRDLGQAGAAPGPQPMPRSAAPSAPMMRPEVEALMGSAIEPVSRGELGTLEELVEQGVPSRIAQSPALSMERAKLLQKEAFEKRKSERKKADLSQYPQDKLLAAGFATRMTESEDIINNLLGDYEQGQFEEDPAAGRRGISGNVASFIESIPSFGLTDAAAAGLVRRTATPEQQQYLNAAENWIRANLRRESGAVISPEEMSQEYSTYFPIAGDSEQVIKQKEKLRKTTARAVQAASGGAYDLMKRMGQDMQPEAETPNVISDDFIERARQELMRRRGQR